MFEKEFYIYEFYHLCNVTDVSSLSIENLKISCFLIELHISLIISALDA